MNLQELKVKNPEELLKEADKLGIEKSLIFEKTGFNVCHT